MSDTATYILKRVIIGTLIALALMFIKGNILTNVYAAGNNYTIYLENSNNSAYNTSASTNTFLNVSGVFNRVSVVSNTNVLASDGKYELYATIELGVDRGSLCTSSNLGLRNDFYIGNSRRTSWITPTTTWNNVDDINLGNNGYCNYTWGSVQTFTSNISSNGLTYDFYFTNPTSINYIRIIRFELINTGSTTSDSINNMTNQIINNQNQNNQTIINNNNENTQNIINNQNENTDREIESQKVCKTIQYSSTSSGNTNNQYLNNSGVPTNSNGYSISEFIPITNTTNINVINRGFNNSCFYDSNKDFISCVQPSSVGSLSVPSNAKYFRITFNNNQNIPIIEVDVCKNGNQAVNDSLTDDSIDSSGANDFFGDFNFGDDTLSSVITAPLRFFNKLSDTCQPITLTYLNQNIVLPCGDTIFWNRQDVSTFRTFWNILFGGLALYYLGTKLYKVVHDAFDPQKDNIEGVDI